MKKILLFLIIFCSFAFLSCGRALAVEGMALSLTPPLIKNNVDPGQIWRSAIKVINNNAQPINVYLQAIDFKSGRENGTVEFIKTPQNLSEEENRYLLSQWIVIDGGPVEVPGFGSAEIPFIIDVPEEAGPGGHYAAVLAGTKPGADSPEGTNIKISSLLASLIFLNVNGDVEEEGRIREFSASRKFFTEPDVVFTVRFENLGNVHIQPRGEIKVYNFFNQQKEKITLNHNSEFGNVLPGGIRRWNFSWSGEKNMLEMGRHRAELVLNYGSLAKETVNQTLYFWIIYPKPLIISISVLLALVLLFVFIVRRYIKKSIMITQSRYAQHPAALAGRQKVQVAGGEDRTENMKVAKKEGALNLKSDSGGGAKRMRPKSGWAYFKKFIIILFVLVIVLILGLVYLNYRHNYSELKNVTPEDKGRSFLENEKDNVPAGADAEEGPSDRKDPEPEAAASSRPAAEESAQDGAAIESPDPDRESAQDLAIKVLNGSGKPGAAGEMADRLSEQNYPEPETANADSFDYPNSLIKYKSGYTSEAGQIAKLFSQTPDLQEDQSQAEAIVIIVGKNFE